MEGGEERRSRRKEVRGGRGQEESGEEVKEWVRFFFNIGYCIY